MRQCDVHGGRYLAAGDPLCFAKAGSLLGRSRTDGGAAGLLRSARHPGAGALTQGSRPFREAFEASWDFPPLNRVVGEYSPSGFAS